MLTAEAEGQADNTNRGLNNFSYPTRTEFNNCFIIYLYLYRSPGKRLPFEEDLSFQKAILHKPH